VTFKPVNARYKPLKNQFKKNLSRKENRLLPLPRLQKSYLKTVGNPWSPLNTRERMKEA